MADLARSRPDPETTVVESELEGRMALEGLPPGVESRHLPCLNESPALAALIVQSVERAGADTRAEALTAVRRG